MHLRSPKHIPGACGEVSCRSRDFAAAALGRSPGKTAGHRKRQGLTRGALWRGARPNARDPERGDSSPRQALGSAARDAALCQVSALDVPARPTACGSCAGLCLFILGKAPKGFDVAMACPNPQTCRLSLVCRERVLATGSVRGRRSPMRDVGVPRVLAVSLRTVSTGPRGLFLRCTND